jgi:hypothetical protein
VVFGEAFRADADVLICAPLLHDTLVCTTPPGEIVLDKENTHKYIKTMKNDEVLITQTSDDAPCFLALVRNITATSVRHAHPTDVFIVRIDHWFDHKWLAFSGKLYGALAFHKPQRLTIPPFIPGRIVSQEAFSLEADRTSYRKRQAQPLHRHQHSGENLSRFVGHISESGVFVWFSGDSARTEHGSMMVYTIHGETQHGWYASFRRGEDWQLYKVEGLSETELKSIIERNEDKHMV